MQHYIAICIQENAGEWRAVFPDVPGCEVRGSDLKDIQMSAENALKKRLKDGGAHATTPAAQAFHRSSAWLAENRVDMAKAIVTMIPVP